MRTKQQSCVVSFSIPKDLIKFLEPMENRSAFISEVLMKYLGDEDFYQKKIEELNEEILFVKKKLLKLEEQRNQYEKILGSLKQKKSYSIQKRLEILEDIVKNRYRNCNDFESLKRGLRSWWEARVDMLQTCDFKTPEEAYNWCLENLKNQVR